MAAATSAAQIIRFTYAHRTTWNVLRGLLLALTVWIFWGLWHDVRFDALGGLSMRELFWMVLVPGMVVIIHFSPTLWRNICPLASTNLLHFVLFGRRRLARLGLAANDRTGFLGWLHDFLRRKGLLLSALFFCLAVPLRLVWFNQSAEATFWLLLAAFTTAFVMGILLPVKSGWCTSLCPISSVEKIYGLNPAFAFKNTRCHFPNPGTGQVQSCSGCSLNCVDVIEPEHAYWQNMARLELHDSVNAVARKTFIAVLPGFLLQYYLVSFQYIELPDDPAGRFGLVYATLAVFILSTFVLYFGVKRFLRFLVERREGALNWTAPSARYALLKHRLDLLWMAVIMNIIWFFTMKGLFGTVLPKAVGLVHGPLSGQLFVAVCTVFAILTLYNVRNGWGESFGPGHYRPSWW